MQKFNLVVVLFMPVRLQASPRDLKAWVAVESLSKYLHL